MALSWPSQVSQKHIFPSLNEACNSTGSAPTAVSKGKQSGNHPSAEFREKSVRGSTKTAVTASGSFRTTTGKALQLSQFPLGFVKGFSYSPHCNTVCYDCTRELPTHQTSDVTEDDNENEAVVVDLHTLQYPGMRSARPSSQPQAALRRFQAPRTLLLTGSHFFFLSKKQNLK